MVSTFGFQMQFARSRTVDHKVFFNYFCCIGLVAELVAALVAALVETLVERVREFSGENRELVERVHGTAPGELTRATTPPQLGSKPTPGVVQPTPPRADQLLKPSE